MNRRVEFKVATSEDVEMAQPTGPQGSELTLRGHLEKALNTRCANSGY